MVATDSHTLCQQSSRDPCHQTQCGSHDQFPPLNICMPYYDVYCTRGSIEHQEYIYLVSEAEAEVLKEEMSDSYDVVGVRRITRKQYLARVSEK